MSTLRNHLPNLQYRLWYEVPVLISKAYGIGNELSGAISLPWDFSPEEFLKKIIHQRSVEIQNEKKKFLKLGQNIEQEITFICHSCDLDDVIISCPHAHCEEALRVLKQSIGALQLAGVHDLSIEISDFFGFRKNGVVIIPATVTPLTLQTFLECGHKENIFSRCRGVYSLSKSMLEQADHHLKEFRSTVKPVSVDAYSTNCTYNERLHWARELRSIAGKLARFDWSEFTFILGPLEINWKKKLMVLPWNFDAIRFINYVEKVHAQAKEKLWDRLVEKEGEHKLAADSEIMKRDTEHEEFQPFYDASVKSSRPQGDAKPISRPGFLQPYHGNVQDHISQQYVVSKGPSDMLHTESPIFPRTTFESDIDVAEHLDWEGFHRDPRKMETESLQTQEDQERAFYALHKGRREKIMRELMESQRDSRRGKKNPENQTYGDYVGITDSKQKVTGMNVIPRGTGPEAPPPLVKG